jgi:cardiolipin synthase A/B
LPEPFQIAAAIHWPLLFAILEVAWVVGMGCWIVLERRTPAATLAWILALSFVPLLGVPVYLFLGPRRLERKKLRMAFARQARSWRLAAWERAVAGELSPMQQLQRLATRLDVAPPETARSVDLLPDGDACYDALVDAVGAARHHVHAEYYIFRPDRAGARLREALVERARAGVEVRLLVDAVGSASLGRFLAPLAEAGGEVARFSPILLGGLRRGAANFRTHRKIVVCDGGVGFTGGINVCDDHSRAARGLAAWRDTHLRIEGAAVHGLQLTFLENWAFATQRDDVVPSPARLRPYFPQGKPGKHLVQIVASGPDQEVHAIEAFTFAAIAGANERVWITTPYFVPGEAILSALGSAALRGVDVQLLLPHATDSWIVDAAGSTYLDALLAAGVKIHVYGPPMVHAKTCVVDRDLAMVGTANLDNRSLRLNFEVLAAVYGGPTVGELARLFEQDRARARPRRAGDGSAPFGRRLLASAARLLAPQL